MSADPADWRVLSDKILSQLPSIPKKKQLCFLKSELSKLPPGNREMVEHFVSVAMLCGEDPEVMMSKHKHISLITIIALIAMIIISLSGLYLVSISDDAASSEFHILGAVVKTNSVGVACLALATLLFIFIAQKALSRL